MDADTIFAVASGAGQAAIAVMRLSGPAQPAVLADAMRTRAAAAPRLVPPAARRGRDRARPGHGGLAAGAGELHRRGLRRTLPARRPRGAVTGVADALVALGARPAEPGEFTRRAFLNGRMDLTEAEAVHDLVAAETEAQRRQALRQLDGALGTLYGGWADRLRLLLAEQEALIDFPDEDLPPEVEAQVLGELAALRAEVAAHLDDDRRGERLREGLVFAVTGRPNVGKSSLVNALAERDVAIVSAMPGTTRDALETRVVLGGVPVTLVDTAGLRDATDEIEAEGVRRARARAAAADLVIVVEEVRLGAEAPAEPGRARGVFCPLWDHPGRQQARSRRRGSCRRDRRQRPDRRGTGDAARPPRRCGAFADRGRRTAATDPGASPRGPAGGLAAPRRRSDRRPAGTARRGSAPGAACARAHHRQCRRGGHPRHAVRAVLHRQIATAARRSCP